MAKATLESATSKRDAELLEWSGSVDFFPFSFEFCETVTVRYLFSCLHYETFVNTPVSVATVLTFTGRGLASNQREKLLIEQNLTFVEEAESKEER